MLSKLLALHNKFGNMVSNALFHLTPYPKGLGMPTCPNAHLPLRNSHAAPSWLQHFPGFSSHFKQAVALSPSTYSLCHALPNRAFPTRTARAAPGLHTGPHSDMI
eukprot:scaffold56303_cov19-Tisochrysis_lutea.AAC.1